MQVDHGVHAGGYRQANRVPSAHRAIARPEPRMGGAWWLEHRPLLDPETLSVVLIAWIPSIVVP